MSAAVFAATAPAAPFVAGAVDFEPVVFVAVEPLGTNGGVPTLVPVFLTTEVGPVTFVPVLVVSTTFFAPVVSMTFFAPVVSTTFLEVSTTFLAVSTTPFVPALVVSTSPFVPAFVVSTVFVFFVPLVFEPVNLSIANLVPAPRAAPANALVNLLPTLEPLVFAPVVPVVFAPVTLAAPVPVEVKVLPVVAAVLEAKLGILEVVLAAVEPFRADVTAVLG